MVEPRTATAAWAGYGPCPTCGRAAGTPCLTPSGEVRELAHARRRLRITNRDVGGAPLAPSARGGRRDSPQRAHYTAQVIAMVEPGIKERVRALAEFDGVSDSAIMREIIAAGLPAVERARTP